MAECTDDRLRLIIERAERLYEERAGINDDIRDLFAEAKAVGYDTPTIRKVLARRRIAPGERQEADLLLETYEAALGGEPVEIPDMRPDATALAVAALSEQIAGIDDPERAAALVEHVIFLLDLRAEIALLRQQEGERKKLAKAEGFEAPQISVTVRWFEKVAKHGLEKMRAGEEVFHLYRGTVDQHAQAREGAAATSDPKLAALFAPAAKPGKPNKAAAMLARLKADAEATRRAIEEGE